jgi:hypothetical protein
MADIGTFFRNLFGLGGPPRNGAMICVSLLKVTFSESSIETYGYDNLDTPADTTDDHVSVKNNTTTYVHVKLEGGHENVEFVCDDTSVAQPGSVPASADADVRQGSLAEFDLAVNGQNPGATVLRARAKSNQCECARININTYKEKQVTAAVMKVYDSTSAGTTLRFPNLDISSIPTLINPKYKAAVAVLSLTDQTTGGGAQDIAFDTDKNGKLTYDIGASGGAEFNLITSKFTVAGQKVIIVRDMVSVYLLAAAAKKGDKTLTMTTSTSFFKAGNTPPLGTGATRETINITAVSGAILTLAAGLANDHASGETIEFPAAGWGGNPIVIIEGSASEDILKWTFGHELGHAVLSLADVNASESIMNYSQSWTDHRLRYKPLPKNYNAGVTENQWETIPR